MKVYQSLASAVHFVVATENTTNHPWYCTTCFTNNRKDKHFAVNQNATCAKYYIYLATCVICHEQYDGQTTNTFSTRCSFHRSNWNKPDCENDNDQSWQYSASHGIVNKPPLQEALLVLLNKKVFTLLIPVRMNVTTNLTQKLIFKAWWYPY